MGRQNRKSRRRLTVTKKRERMYTVKNVLLEQLKTIPKRVKVLLSGSEILDNIVQALLVDGLILNRERLFPRIPRSCWTLY